MYIYGMETINETTVRIVAELTREERQMIDSICRIKGWTIKTAILRSTECLIAKDRDLVSLRKQL